MFKKFILLPFTLLLNISLYAYEDITKTQLLPICGIDEYKIENTNKKEKYLLLLKDLQIPNIEKIEFESLNIIYKSNNGIESGIVGFDTYIVFDSESGISLNTLKEINKQQFNKVIITYKKNKDIRTIVINVIFYSEEFDFNKKLCDKQIEIENYKIKLDKLRGFSE